MAWSALRIWPRPANGCWYLEAREVVGGAAATEEFYLGLRNSVVAYTVSLLQPKVIADLALERYALRLERLTKRLRSPRGRRGRCSESACTTRTLRFLRAVSTHLTTARYVLLAALGAAPHQ